MSLPTDPNLKLIGDFQTRVAENTSPDTDTKQTSFGLPAIRPYTIAYCNTDYTISLRVYSDLSIYARVSGRIFQYSIVRNVYPVAFYISKYNWQWGINGNGLYCIPAAQQMTSASINVTFFPGSYSNPNFSWDMNSDWQYICNLQELQWSLSDQRDAYLYVGGCGEYGADDYLWPTPSRIVISGIRVLLDYYPWAVSDSSKVFRSCNRNGGFNKRYERDNSAWIDRKNSENDPSKNTVFYRQGASWLPAKKTGTNS